MPSKRKIASCRANGAKAKGAKSPEVRQKSALNSLWHGLCATAVDAMVLPNEDPKLFLQLHDSYMRRYRPQDECERQILLQIVYVVWRMRRVPTMETTLLHSEILRINKRDDDVNGFKNMGESFKVGLAFKNLRMRNAHSISSIVMKPAPPQPHYSHEGTQPSAGESAFSRSR